MPLPAASSVRRRWEHVFVSEIETRVRELRAAGLPTTEIAHRLGVAQATVHYHVRKLVEPVEPKQRRLPGVRRGAVNHVRTRERVARLLSEGLTRGEVARRLGIAKSTVSYHARRLGEPIDERATRRYDWNAIRSYYELGYSVRECARTFGFSIWSWHQAVKRGLVVPRPGFRPLEEIFAQNTRRDRGHLKQRLLRAGLKEDRCERCRLSTWMGNAITISLHHINGDRHDNRLENLQLLCPNCHSQTDTFGGRNGRRALST
jgi:DNA-binding CsgD family transcriptional regulator